MSVRGVTARQLRFVLCADDYAFSPAVSRGVLEALAARRISATGAMTTRPSWPEAARALARFAGVADLGLHLNLTAGAPLTHMPRFAPEGVLPALRTLLAAAQAGRLPEAEIRSEIDAQLDAFAAAMGCGPDFLDGHQHVQLLPGVRVWIFDALEKRGLAGKIYLRDSADRVSAIVRRGAQIPKALYLTRLARGFAQEARARGFAVNAGFAGYSGFDPKADQTAAFARFLVAPGARHLIMCHPGHVDAELAAIDSVTDARESELAFLLSDAFPTLLARKGAALARFHELTPP